MQYEMPKLVSAIETAVFGGLLGIQKHKRRALTPHGECVNFRSVQREREHANTFGFKQMNDVLNRQFSDTPTLPQCFGSGFRSSLLAEIGQIRHWELESRFDPRIEQQRYRASTECAVP